MVKMAKFFGYFFFFLAMVLFFLPKVQLYYLLEHEIKPSKVLINQESVRDTGFSLELRDAQILYEGIESANVASIDLSFFLFYNRILAKDITLSSAAKSFVPLEIETIKLEHLFYNPLLVKAEAQGAFGEAYVRINLLERSLELRLLPSERMKKEFMHTLRQLKKDQNGEYIYAKNF